MFNEAEVLASVLESLATLFPNVLCIDDGSTDSSAQIARSKGVRVVTHALNIGQGGALETAFRILSAENQYQYLVTFDADGQHDPGDAQRMIMRLAESEADVAFASRFLDSDRTQVPVLKRVVLKTVVKLNRLLTDVDLTDTHNGLRAIRIHQLHKISLFHFSMAHATELVSKILQANLRYVEIPAKIRYTPYSIRKGQSLFNSINIMLDFLWR